MGPLSYLMVFILKSFWSVECLVPRCLPPCSLPRRTSSVSALCSLWLPEEQQGVGLVQTQGARRSLGAQCGSRCVGRLEWDRMSSLHCFAASRRSTAHRPHSGAAQEPWPVWQLPLDCLADVDTKPAYQNFRQKVYNLCQQIWTNSNGILHWTRSFPDKRCKKKVSKWAESESGSVRLVGSRNGQDHFSGSGPHTKPHLQATNRASNPGIPGYSEKRSCASSPSRTWKPGPSSAISRRFLRICLIPLDSSI